MSFSFSRIRHLLIDLDGVLFRGQLPLPAAAEFIAFLRARGISFRLVTNNATLTQRQYQDKLAGMGIAVEAAEVFTSSLATAQYLDRQGQRGTSAYIIGELGLRDALDSLGVRVTEDRPEWVIVGLDRELTYDKLSVAALAINSGAHFLGTNPDTSFPTERGLLPGAGSILAALAATTGVKPVVIGKPEPLMLRLATEALGGTVEETAMLGDRLDTDIQGAESLGMASILVLTGVSTRDDVQHGSIHPTLVVETLSALMRLWPAIVAR